MTVSIRQRLIRARAVSGLILVVLSLFVAVIQATPVQAAAGINKQINFQGKVVNANGTNVTDGTYSFTFSLYTVSSAGTATWTETKNLSVADGVFQTQLGDTTALPGSVNFDQDQLYLGVNFNNDGEMSPRIQLTAAAYAFQADNADKLGGLAASSYVQLNPSTAQSGSINVNGSVAAASSLQAPLVDTATAVALNVGTSTASSVTVGRATSSNAVTIQGSAASSWVVTGASGTTTLNFTAPTHANTITFADAGGTVCTTISSTCGTTYQAYSSTGYLLKNAADSSSASTLGSLLGLTNTNTGAAGVLSLTNAGTNSALSVTQSANPTSGQALILANNTNGTASGNLLDLQVGGTSKYSVNSGGNVTGGTLNSQTISSTANFTGTVAIATSVTVPQIQTQDQSSPSGNSAVLTIRSGNATGTTANSGNVSIDSGTATGTAGQINVGTTSASAINLGRNGITTGVTGILSVVSSTTNSALTISQSGNPVSGQAVLSVNNTAGTPSGNLIDLRAGAASRFSVNTVGNVTAGGTYNGNTLSSTQFLFASAGTVGSGSGSALSFTNGSGAGSYLFNGTAPIIDSASGTALQLGGANASSIIVGGSATTSLTVGRTAATFTLQGASTGSTITGTNGSFTTTVGFTTPTTNNAINFPNEGGTVCLQSSQNCGFLLGAAGSYIVNQTTTQTNSNFNISGIGVAGQAFNSNVFSSADSTTANTSDVTVRSGNTAVGANLSSGNVNIDAGSKTGTGTAGSVNIGTTNAGAVNLGRPGGQMTIQGATSTSSLIFSGGGNATTVTFTAPTAARSVVFADAGGTVCTTTASTCNTTYQAAGNYLLQNPAANQTSTSNFGGYQYSFTQSNSTAAGNLLLTNSGTSAALAITQNSTPSAGQAALLVNAGTSVTGNLIDLQLSSASKFKVDTTGAVTTAGSINGQTISSAANFTGTVTSASTVTVTAGGLTVSAGGASIGGALAVTSAAQSTLTGGIKISGGLDNSSGGITNAGSIAGATTVAANNTLTLSGTGANELNISGAPLTAAGASTSSLIQIGSAIASGSANGTYIGLNAPNGSTADLMNLQVNGASKLAVTSAGAISAGTYNGQTLSSTALFTGTVSAVTGFRINGGASTGTFLRADGTNYVASLLQPGDVPACTGTCNYIANQTSQQASSNFNISGAGVIGNALTVSAGGAAITGNSSVTGTLGATNTLTLSGTGANELNISGAPLTAAGASTSSLIQIGSAIASGSANGTYIGLNAPNGSTADLMNLQVNGASKLAVTSAGAISAGTYNGQTISSAANFTGTLTTGGALTVSTGGAAITGNSTITGSLGGITGLTVASGGIVNNGGGITGAGAVAGATTVDASTSVTAPLHSSADTNAASTNSSAVTFRSGNAAGTTSNSGSVTLDSGTATGTTGAVNVGTANASAVGIGRTGAALSLQGSQTSSLVVGNGTNTTTVNFANPTGNATYTLGTAATGSYAICTSVATSCNSVYQAAGSYLLQNPASAQTSSANFTGYEYSFSNNNGTGSGVLSLTGSGTNATLVVTAASNPSAGQAVIVANNTATTPSGNLIDLQVNSASKFSVNTAGALTVGTVNGQTISSAASFTGTVTSASTITATAGGINVTGTGTFNNTVNVSGALTASGGASISTGLNNNSGGITGAGAVGGVTGITFSSAGNIDASAATAINIGTTTASGISVGRAGGTLSLQGNAATSLVANSGTNSTTLNFVTPTANVIYQFGTAAGGTYQICSTAVVCSGYAPTSASGAYLQLAPTAAQGDASANSSIFINKTGTTNIVRLQSSGADVFTVQSNGVLTSTATDNLGNGLMTVDTSQFKVRIGSGTPSLGNGTSNANAALFVSGAAEFAGALRFGDGTNSVGIDGTTKEISFAGTARHQKTLRLTAEYAGAVLDASGSSNTGTMTAAFDATQRMSYYKWTTGQSTAQSYDVVVNMPVPDDWSAWNGNPTFKDYISATGEAATVTITRSDGTVDTGFNALAITPGTAATWTTYSGTALNTTGYSAGGVMTIRIHLSATTNQDVRLGDITLPYLSRY